MRVKNEVSNHSLLWRFQFRKFGIMIDSISHGHGRAQQMIVKDIKGSNAITLDLAGCNIHFRHRLPTTQEIVTINIIV
jgi:hypothetical protein